MRTLTPNLLKNYIKDYDYEITINQAKEVLKLLDGYGIFSCEDIQEATDYIVNGSQSKYAKLFE